MKEIQYEIVKEIAVLSKGDSGYTKDIESGLINCVITKDLSRLGRNYLDCGLYLEVFFPEHNVRYIAVNDGVDTLNKSAIKALRNWTQPS